MPHVTEREPVKGVRARPRDGVHDRADVAAVFRAERVGLHAEFLQRVRIRHRVGRVAVMIVVGPAVEHVVGGVRARPARRNRLRAWIGGARREARARVGLHARDELHQLRRVPAVQRQLLDPALVDHRAQRSRRGVDRRRHAADGDRLRDRSHLQRDVQPDVLVHADDHVSVPGGLEAGQLRNNGVAADRQPAQDVYPELVGHGVRGGVRRLVGRPDAHAGHHATSGITDDPGDPAGGGLSSRWHGRCRENQCHDRGEKT